MSIEYRNVVVPLKDGAVAPSQDCLAKSFWLLTRNSSVTYIARMSQLLENFNRAYQELLKKDPNYYPEIATQCLYSSDDIKKGLQRLLKGDHSGYRLIGNVLHFQEFF